MVRLNTASDIPCVSLPNTEMAQVCYTLGVSWTYSSKPLKQLKRKVTYKKGDCDLKHSSCVFFLMKPWEMLYNLWLLKN